MSIRLSSFVLSWLFAVLMLFTTCQGDNTQADTTSNPCAACPLPLSASEQGSNSSTTLSSEGQVNGGITIDASIIKKLVAGEINLDGGYKQGQISSENVYWKLINSNPEIVQNTNLYRNITCALLQIVCEDPTITEREKSQEKRTLITEFRAKVDQLLSIGEAVVKPTSSPITAPQKTRQRNTSVPAQPATAQPVYFTSSSFVPLAVLSVGDKSYLDLSQGLKRYSTEQGIGASNGMLKPTFWSQFKNRIRALDTELFQEVAAAKYTNCVCILDQAVRVREGSLAGEKTITVIGDIKVWLFNLKTGEVGQAAFEKRGAGLTISRVMEDLDRKVRDEYPNLELNFSSCR
ncbi:hypothetical protein [Lewinella cohaerens]|uniref:hypothetical protein n=1 Tax=Lewinella cohaerens TaxID=70995 RepID=UPI0003649640|nr:hypothetical protein [Lewinella cohaerens]